MIDEQQQQQQQQDKHRTEAKRAQRTGAIKVTRSLFSALFAPKQGKLSLVQQESGAGCADDQLEDSRGSQSLGRGERQAADRQEVGAAESCTVGEQSEEEEEEDSYQLDLRDRLRRERLRVGVVGKSEERAASFASQLKDVAESKGQAVGKNLLVEQFLSAHKIHFDSQMELSSSEESCDQIRETTQGVAYRTRPAREASLRGGGSASENVKPRRAVQSRVGGSFSERDSRLASWRKLAARSMWSTDSPPSSDSELDLLESRSPALALTCSDDTSCSSVELVWSRSCGLRCAEREPLQSKQSSCHQISRLNEDGQARPESPIGRVEMDIVGVGRAREFKLLGSDLHQQRLIKRLSIFELAKPGRARRRRTETGLEQASVQWVANPLFSKATNALPRRSASHDSIMQPQLNLLETNHPRLCVEEESQTVASSETSITIDFDDSSDGLSDELKMGANFEPSKAVWSAGSKSPGKWRRDNVYLSRILELDRRIKSNVSSIKSQLSVRLSDTGKRASILADQLIASIKYTTKEHLFSASDTISSRTNYHDKTLQNSFSNLSIQTGAASDTNEPSTKKAQLFSLIYKHQQQANGQPVVTRQPTATGNFIGLLAPTVDKSWPSGESKSTQIRTAERRERGQTRLEPTQDAKPNANPPEQANLEARIPPAKLEDDMETRKEDSCARSPETRESSRPTSRASSCMGARTCESADQVAPQQGIRRTKKLRRKRTLHRLGQAEEADEFYQVEFARFRALLDGANSERQRKNRLRSLNYWRRFRMRKLGADLRVMLAAQPQAGRSSEIDLEKLEGLFTSRSSN